jgi:hypothetical protein
MTGLTTAVFMSTAGVMTAVFMSMSVT